jgi:hypothetical protein
VLRQFRLQNFQTSGYTASRLQEQPRALVENKSIARLLVSEGTPVAFSKMLSHRSSHQGRGTQHDHFPCEAGSIQP